MRFEKRILHHTTQIDFMTVEMLFIWSPWSENFDFEVGESSSQCELLFQKLDRRLSLSRVQAVEFRLHGNVVVNVFVNVRAGAKLEGM